MEDKAFIALVYAIMIALIMIDIFRGNTRERKHQGTVRVPPAKHMPPPPPPDTTIDNVLRIPRLNKLDLPYQDHMFNVLICKEKIKEELEEFEEAWISCGHGQAEPPDVAEELLDIAQAARTALDELCSHFGMDPQEMLKKHYQKHRERGNL